MQATDAAATLAPFGNGALERRICKLRYSAAMGFFRTLLLCLLVLAVPAQGSAAITMAFCGPNHHGSEPATAAAQAVGTEHGTQHPGSSDHGDHGDPANPHHAQAGPDDGAAASDPAAEQPKSVHGGKHKCSACASCCSAAAILSDLPVLVTPTAAATVFAALVPTVGAFTPDGLERPPRHVFA